MSTRCRIGIENKDKKITSIYCHHDGYVHGGVGEKLFIHYKDEDKIRKLMELGDMSSLGTEPVSNPKAWESPGLGCKDWSKAFDELHPKNMCDTYASRGETCPAKTSTLKTALKHFNNSDQEYFYLFRNGKWLIIERGETAKDFRPLSKELD